MKSMNDLVNACATIGDWGGYKIYEWYKLFPEERERALREYMYLKTHMIQDCAHQVGLHPSLEVWNDFLIRLALPLNWILPIFAMPPTMDLWRPCMPMKAKSSTPF
ncbi:MAG: hypothetical protein ACLVLA_13395 [Acidaminococcus intestini]